MFGLGKTKKQKEYEKNFSFKYLSYYNKAFGLSKKDVTTADDLKGSFKSKVDLEVMAERQYIEANYDLQDRGALIGCCDDINGDIKVFAKWTGYLSSIVAMMFDRKNLIDCSDLTSSTTNQKETQSASFGSVSNSYWNANWETGYSYANPGPDRFHRTSAVLNSLYYLLYNEYNNKEKRENLEKELDVYFNKRFMEMKNSIKEKLDTSEKCEKFITEAMEEEPFDKGFYLDEVHNTIINFKDTELEEILLKYVPVGIVRQTRSPHTYNYPHDKAFDFNKIYPDYK